MLDGHGYFGYLHLYLLYIWETLHICVLTDILMFIIFQGSNAAMDGWLNARYCTHEQTIISAAGMFFSW